MWYVKMYFSEKRELFQCDASGIQGVPSVDREFPFLESLLTFLEMDCGELTPILQRIADRWSRLIAEFDRDAGTEAMVELGQLKSRHIYLELLYVRWYERFTRMGIYKDRGSAEDQKMLEELRQLNDGLELWVLPVMFGKSNTHKAVMAHLRSLGHRVTLTTIRRSVIAESYTAASLPLPVYSPRCGVAKDYEALAYEVMAWNDESEVETK